MKSIVQAVGSERRVSTFLSHYEVVPWVMVLLMAAFWPRGQGAAPACQGKRGGTDPSPAKGGVTDAQDLARAAERGRGRDAVRPSQIPHRGWIDIAWRAVLEIQRDRLPAVAGGVTFYALLAIFPGIGAFVALYGLVTDPTDVREQLGQMSTFLPRDVLIIVGDQMFRAVSSRTEGLSLTLVFSLLLSIWSASAGLKALFDALNVAYNEPERRTFIHRTLLSYGSTLGTLVLFVAVFAIFVALPLTLPGLSDWPWAPLWLIVRSLVVLGMATTAFSLLYRYGPSRQKAKWRWVTYGSVTAAVLWMAGSLGFSFYVTNIGHFDRTYGPLGAIMGFMIWLWFSSFVVLLGAELNSEIEHQTAQDSTTGPPMPLGARGASMADTVGAGHQTPAWLKKLTSRRRLKAKA